MPLFSLCCFKSEVDDGKVLGDTVDTKGVNGLTKVEDNPSASLNDSKVSQLAKSLEIKVPLLNPSAASKKKFKQSQSPTETKVEIVQMIELSSGIEAVMSRPTIRPSVDRKLQRGRKRPTKKSCEKSLDKAWNMDTLMGIIKHHTSIPPVPSDTYYFHSLEFRYHSIVADEERVKLKVHCEELPPLDELIVEEKPSENIEDSECPEEIDAVEAPDATPQEVEKDSPQVVEEPKENPNPNKMQEKRMSESVSANLPSIKGKNIKPRTTALETSNSSKIDTGAESSVKDMFNLFNEKQLSNGSKAPTPVKHA